MSVFDRIGGLEVGKALHSGTPLDPAALRDFIRARMTGSLQPDGVEDRRVRMRDEQNSLVVTGAQSY